MLIEAVEVLNYISAKVYLRRTTWHTFRFHLIWKSGRDGNIRKKLLKVILRDTGIFPAFFAKSCKWINCEIKESALLSIWRGRIEEAPISAAAATSNSWSDSNRRQDFRRRDQWQIDVTNRQKRLMASATTNCPRCWVRPLGRSGSFRAGYFESSHLSRLWREDLEIKKNNNIYCSNKTPIRML